MWRLKGCPRCGGDVHIDRDHHGWFEECLQCGYTADLVDIGEFRKWRSAKEKETEKEPALATTR